jgi:hypothetical protein
MKREKSLGEENSVSLEKEKKRKEKEIRTHQQRLQFEGMPQAPCVECRVFQMGGIICLIAAGVCIEGGFFDEEEEEEARG